MSKTNNNVNKSSSSSSAINLDSQVIDLTNDDENMMPPPPPLPTTTNNKRKMPLQVGVKKLMLLPYDKMVKPVVFFGYKMYYLSRAQQLAFTNKVKIFQCGNSIVNNNNDIRLGIAEIDAQDMMSFIKLLNNVAGSLPVTTSSVKRPFEEGDDVVFVTLKKTKAALFDHRGVVMAFDKLPKVCEAKVAITISGMKVKDDEASFIFNVTQVMVKKAIGESRCEPPKLLFDVSSEDEDMME